MSFISFKVVQKDLQTIKSQVSQVTKDVPLDKITEFSDVLSGIQEETQKFTPTINMAEKLRYHS